MHYSSNFIVSAAVLILAPFAVALPTDDLAARRSSPKINKITQVLNKHHIANGPMAYAKALERYNAPISSDLHTAVLVARNTTEFARRQVAGSVTAAPQAGYDTEYLSPVSIGSPAQTLHLDFDTGSADLWVFGPQTSGRSSQTAYAPGRSTSAKLMSGSTWKIGYGDGSGASGNVYTDRVAVGGVTVVGQAVEVAQKVSSSFSGDTGSSGLMGLAFPSINTISPTKQNTWIANAKRGLISPLFTTQLKYHQAGSYTFGEIDHSAYSSKAITYTPVDKSSGFWGFTSSGYAVGTHPFQATNIKAVADTGTSLLLMDDKIVRDFYSRVAGAQYSSSAGGYTFPCANTAPTLTFGIGNYRGIIPGKHLNYAPVSSGGKTCFGGLQSNNGIGMTIFGDIALKSQFVVWDLGNTRLGFAQQGTSSNRKTTSTTATTSGGSMISSLLTSLGM